jgi:outer membrane protein OmpA-like peptidoglycan-associated protein
LLSLLIALLASGGTAWAQEPDAEGSKDHPVFSRLQGYYINSYDEQEFSVYEFGLEPPRRIEGHYWNIQYVLNEGARKAGALQIGRNYTNLIKQRGGAMLREDLDASGGTTIARLPVKGGGQLWLEVHVSNSGEVYTLHVIEEQAMKQEVAFTAESLASALNTSGSVAIRDILFDTGKATIQPSSAATLTMIADMLNANPDLALEIQGHTDNVGTAAANLALSRERAASVKAALLKAGIAGERLATAGFGDTQPVADNGSDDGRARNRRVELVKK